MNRVLIIYTGGTIGMTRTDDGYAPRSTISPTCTRRKCRRGSLSSFLRCSIPPI